MSEKRYGYITVVFDAVLAASPERISSIISRWLRKERHVASVHIESIPKSGASMYIPIELRLNDDRDQIGKLHQYAGKVRIDGDTSSSYVVVEFFDWETVDDRSDACDIAKVNDYATVPHQGKIFEQLVEALRREATVLQDNLEKMETVNVPAQDESGKVEKVERKGRYRLSDDEIKFRRKKVKEANSEKKKNPLKRWGEIDAEFADRLRISSGSFRHWRHNNY